MLRISKFLEPHHVRFLSKQKKKRGPQISLSRCFLRLFSGKSFCFGHGPPTTFGCWWIRAAWQECSQQIRQSVCKPLVGNMTYILNSQQNTWPTILRKKNEPIIQSTVVNSESSELMRVSYSPSQIQGFKSQEQVGNPHQHGTSWHHDSSPKVLGSSQNLPAGLFFC